MKSFTPALVGLMTLGTLGLLVAAYIGKSLLAQQEQPAPSSVRTAPVALMDIAPDTIITEQHIGRGTVDMAKYPGDVIVSERIILGRRAQHLIKATEPIRAGDLHEPGYQPTLDVAEGMKAVTIELNGATAAVDGMVRAGQYVDVHFTPAASAGARLPGGVTMTLFQGVKLLHLSRTAAGSRGLRATFELAPLQANVILLAKNRGEIDLAITTTGPGNGGLALEGDQRAALEAFLGLRAVAVDKPFVTEIFYGSTSGRVSFGGGTRVASGVGLGGGGFGGFAGGGLSQSGLGRNGGGGGGGRGGNRSNIRINGNGNGSRFGGGNRGGGGSNGGGGEGGGEGGGGEGEGEGGEEY